MSDSPLSLPAHPSLEQIRKQAKDLLRSVRAADAEALARVRAVLPQRVAAEPGSRLALADAQFIVAREYGFDSWAALARHIRTAQLADRVERYEGLARDFAAACGGDEDALARINDLSSRPLTAERIRERIRERLLAVTGTDIDADALSLRDAKLFVAREHGFESWAALLGSFEPPARPATGRRPATPAFYKIDWKRDTIEPGPMLSEKEWDEIVEAMRAHRITGLNANGQMTDAALGKIARLDFVRRLNLDGSKRVTDDGLLRLAGAPQLRELDLSGWESAVTDRGLAVLRRLPELRRLQMCWPQRVTDAGLAHLAECGLLEDVNLLGTPTGDGAIRALAGNPNLRHLKTGKLTTDDGLAALRQIPRFKTWQGGEIEYGLMTFAAEPTHLLLDGPFTDRGLAGLATLEGLFGLTFFWHVSAMTPGGIKALAAFPNLGYLGCQGQLCDDTAMRYIGESPTLRMLMGQGTVASDDGFAALSRSRTIEYLWGRECPNLTGRGFRALATMPALRGLAVSCKNVDDASLTALPSFPALRALMPMDVGDDGFRHVGRCAGLEDLWCMYCRDTGDAASEHLIGLSRLKSYYAGKTRITDRTLEILSGLSTIEKVEFWECAGVTNAGIARLTRLPRLRELVVSGCPNVTRDGLAGLPDRIQVRA